MLSSSLLLLHALVSDLAAGTGKVTRLLLNLVSLENIVAVEPLDGMRKQFIRSTPGVKVLAGTAERIPLEDSSVDVVIVGDAFHWFGVEAVSEIARVLKPGGRLCAQWNDPDAVNGPLFMKNLFHKVVGSRKPAATPTYWSGKWRAGIEASSQFSPIRTTRVSHTVTMSPRQVENFVLSLSWIAHLGEDERERVKAEIGRELEADPYSAGKTSFTVPYNTDIHYTTLAK
eukprot:CAMPEP_0177674676 /NCGR_PEP_ID=MMETSP0447-20121125/26715_1 /TAXON_ID=0 /ORGANISM="Stygamoeba regulata, Strain BSH-02190019" /LENGTH=228 /DNA_ID=CAMNT_0019182853 /DNA_START=1000 /DNA_END=1686 /DNA_ORIENTATION=-